LVLVILMVTFLRFSVIESATLAIFAVLLHWVGDISHQLGHARAARKAGYPMIGIRLWGLLTSSIYPRDEPALPGKVHISRALGGPTMSFIIGLISAIPLLFLEAGSVFWWLFLFFAADNLLVLSLGAFLPLGFTDGSTILRWLRK
jgi:Zn-dependent protease